MKWSINVGKVLDIDVYLHFTFLLLFAFLGVVAWQSTGRIDLALDAVFFIAALFGCVLLHELGHAMMARAYGIGTSDITLLPIGGVARLERMPERPGQELCVSLAGPAVNLVIAALLFLWLAANRNFTFMEDLSLTSGSLAQRLMTVNLALVAFNLLPAFPMDGGRILRALLSPRLGRHRATATAANVGQGMAILFGVAGFFYNPFLIFIGVSVFLGAQAEAGLVEMQTALKGLRVRDAMLTRFRTFSTQVTLGQAVDELLASSQQDFPVTANEHYAGLLRRNDLVNALKADRRDTKVVEVMRRDCDTVDESASLQQTIETMQAGHYGSVPVVQGARVVGLLTMDAIGKMILVNDATAQHDTEVTADGPRVQVLSDEAAQRSQFRGFLGSMD